MSLITIASQDIADWHGLETPAYARLISNQEFVTSENVIVAPGNGFYQQFTCSVVSNKIRIASGSAYSTTDSDTPWATYTLAIYSAKGSLLTTVAGNLRIPNAPSSTTWTALIEYSQSRVQPYRFAFYDTNQINVLLNNYALLSGAAFSGNITVPDDAFAASWDNNLAVPTKNSLYDAINPFWTPINKLADEPRQNNTTLTADSQLVIPAVLPASNYVFELGVWYTTVAAADFKFAMVAPAGAFYCRGETVAPDGTATSLTVNGSASIPSTSILSAIDGIGQIYIRGLIQNVSSAGNIAFQWAQNTANGTPTQVYQMSYLRYKRT